MLKRQCTKFYQFYPDIDEKIHHLFGYKRIRFNKEKNLVKEVYEILMEYEAAKSKFSPGAESARRELKNLLSEAQSKGLIVIKV